MSIVMRVVAPLVCAFVGLHAVVATAETTPAASSATVAGRNAIESIQSSSDGGNVTIKVTLRQPLEGQLGSFSVSNPARVAIDFPSTMNGLGKTAQSINEGDVRSANIVQVADRTRMVINLLRPLTYETRVEGREISIVFAPIGAKASEATAKTPSFAEQKGGPEAHAIRDIGFRRGQNGVGRVVVDMSDSNTGIDIHQQGKNLIVEFLKTSLPANLRKSLDVTDFGTPVSSVVTTQQGNSVRMVITPSGLWEHNAYQTDTQFVVEVKPIQEDPRKLVQGAGANKYAGEKLSLNFQNIDVRSVLQVISDFTNFNIITSDSVTGSLTLRLKDVPWDQALEIILQAKGLDMRKNGNVIWIAPKDELALREKADLEAKTQITDLEPLRTETFQVNYHSAKAIYDGILKDKDKSKALLSQRGSIIMDERSNKLIMTDVAARLDDMRRVLTEIDIPVRQVLIEAQIVEATDDFQKSIGVKLGIGGGLGSSAAGKRLYFGGALQSSAYQAGLVTDKATLTQAQLTNFAASSSDTASPFSTSFVLWNSAATRFLDMEVSALETDGRGKVVSRPKVMTSDQAEALIESGTELAYTSASSSGATTVSFKKAMLSLKVTPQITPDGRVYMTVDVNKDKPNYTNATSQGVPIDTKHVMTKVLVDNGGTVVIGGIFQQDTSDVTDKVPLLGDIPWLGNLFKQRTVYDKKTELLVFLTPRIVTDQNLVR